MKSKLGIVAFSFGSHPGFEPNPCNAALAREAARLKREAEYDGYDVTLVAQGEVAVALRLDGIEVAAAVTKREFDPHRYLHSEEVIVQASRIFRAQGIHVVTPVAHPFLKLWHCKRLVRHYGFAVRPRRVAWIGFHPKSEHWHARGPVRLALYAAYRFVVGYR